MLLEDCPQNIRHCSDGSLTFKLALEFEMSHTRLGTIPKTQKWNEVVRTATAFCLSGEITADEAIGTIAAQTLDAAKGALFLAARDPGVRYSFYLLTQITLASRLRIGRMPLREMVLT